MDFGDGLTAAKASSTTNVGHWLAFDNGTGQGLSDTKATSVEEVIS